LKASISNVILGSSPMNDLAKSRAAERAIQFVESGQVVGLGTGSTAALAIQGLGRLVKQGLTITGVPTSTRSERIARELGIPLVTLNDCLRLDITIDGADQIDDRFDMIKGGGGALIREKLVAIASDREIIVVDESKLVSRLGVSVPLPVEVLQFAWRLSSRLLAELGCVPKLRESAGLPFESDNGNYILDCDFGAITDPRSLEASIRQVPGVVESGLFVGLAQTVVIGSESGVEVRNRQA
jgi:ribose 5-phosphate isomerase A